jgi:carbon-monoxide dehydrogenase medium subunit
LKPAPFEYHRPASAEEGVGLLAQLGEDAKFLAGGQSLIPLLALRLTRFDHLIDLNRAPDLARTEVGAAEVRLGPMVRQAAVLADADLGRAVPLLGAATRHIGHFQIRNRGTVGGSLAHADPAAEYPAVALALDATMDLRSASGTRSVPASEFFVSTFVTAMEPDELLVGIRFPVWGARSAFAVTETARRVGDFAIAGAAVGIELDGSDRIGRAAIGLFGMGSTPLRAAAAEVALVGSTAAELTAEARAQIGREATAGLDPPGDVHAQPAYRLELAAAMVERALQDALGSAGAEGDR